MKFKHFWSRVTQFKRFLLFSIVFSYCVVIKDKQWTFELWKFICAPKSINLLNGRRIYGGCTPPFTILFYFWLRSLRYGKDFLQVLSKLSQTSMVKTSHFSDEWKVVFVALQRGVVYNPHKSRGVFFWHIGHGN